MPDIKAEVMLWLVTTAVPVVSLYITNKAKITESEHRQTVLEMKVNHLEEKVERNAARLDNHEEQNKALIAMTEQMKSLTEDVKELKTIIKGGIHR